MRPFASALLFALAWSCSGRGGDGTRVSGDLDGEIFDPATVVFDDYGPGPGDSGIVDPAQLALVLADAPEVCPLLGPLFHYWWLRCESTCEGLYAQQALWPEEPLRVLWLVAVADGELEGDYQLSAAGGPGLFSASYRPVDLSRLEGMDQAACYEACVEDYGFLLVDQGAASLGDLSVEGHGAELLEGSFDLLFSQGSVEAVFEAPRCDMGLHGP
jgi:hypothetical protein